MSLTNAHAHTSNIANTHPIAPPYRRKPHDAQPQKFHSYPRREPNERAKKPSDARIHDPLIRKAGRVVRGEEGREEIG